MLLPAVFLRIAPVQGPLFVSPPAFTTKRRVPGSCLATGKQKLARHKPEPPLRNRSISIDMFTKKTRRPQCEESNACMKPSTRNGASPQKLQSKYYRKDDVFLSNTRHDLRCKWRTELSTQNPSCQLFMCGGGAQITLERRRATKLPKALTRKTRSESSEPIIWDPSWLCLIDWQTRPNT